MKSTKLKTKTAKKSKKTEKIFFTDNLTLSKVLYKQTDNRERERERIGWRTDNNRNERDRNNFLLGNSTLSEGQSCNRMQTYLWFPQFLQENFFQSLKVTLTLTPLTSHYIIQLCWQLYTILTIIKRDFFIISQDIICYLKHGLGLNRPAQEWKKKEI